MNTNKWTLIGIAFGLVLVVGWYAGQDADEPMIKSSLPTPYPVTQSAEQSAKPLPAAIAPAAVLPLESKAAASVKDSLSEDIDDYVEWQREVIAGLIVLNDADSLMAAALILHSLDANDVKARRTIANLLMRAHVAAPTDRGIAAVALRVCRSMPGCSGPAFEEFVRNADAHNALGPLPELLTKIEKGTANDVTEALNTLAKLRLNLYNGEMPARVVRAIASTPTSPRFAPTTSNLLHLQSELALRAVEAIEVPNYLAVGPACQTQNWRQVAACQAITRDLSRSELLELQRLSLALESMMTPNRRARSTESNDAEEYLNWIGGNKMHHPPPPEHWIPLLAQHRSELAALRAWLDSNGVEQRRVPKWLER
jgi:hypothetical protein